ncbi:hydrolase, haloacid dehalogenase-like family protein [Fulvimarina pelagi HTCC2506]|uniref:Hydrolase, haloacid dehalogenase-like family protein n=1 Tax=Fulvimarina pelagi HTCC2506 TaxID=314231 RepID=Q0G3R2_9HYPH|nr:TIGR01459 family HAD-type hydrolase [Fulvimarina pelagi]EAU41769.1 hydrolase, haloacid dehalogenase-like family protein [Fulvimarina pelagi HTCC2506]
MAETTAEESRRIERLEDVTEGYGAIICDVWGVVHNGVSKFAAAEEALLSARHDGLKVVLLTNSPRPHDGVVAQLESMGFDRNAFDHIVTSGDATRDLIAKGDGPVYHIGPERDLDLFKGLEVERVPMDEASRIVASGLFDDENETPDDYRELLKDLRDRELTMICANPDVVVQRGEKLIYCAGAIAREYAALGGEVAFAGKPHRPIYELAAERIGFGEAERHRILAIGDGMPTDIKGAKAFGLDVLFITRGIHGDELNSVDPSAESVTRLLGQNGLSAQYFMPALR